MFAILKYKWSLKQFLHFTPFHVISSNHHNVLQMKYVQFSDIAHISEQANVTHIKSTSAGTQVSSDKWQVK